MRGRHPPHVRRACPRRLPVRLPRHRRPASDSRRLIVSPGRCWLPEAGGRGAGRSSCTRPGPGPAGASVTWPTCARSGRGPRPRAPGSCSSTRCTRSRRPCRRRPARTCRRPGASATRSTCASTRCRVPTASTGRRRPGRDDDLDERADRPRRRLAGSSARRSSRSSPPAASADGVRRLARATRAGRSRLRDLVRAGRASMARTGATGPRACGGRDPDGVRRLSDDPEHTDRVRLPRLAAVGARPAVPRGHGRPDGAAGPADRRRRRRRRRLGLAGHAGRRRDGRGAA